MKKKLISIMLVLSLFLIAADWSKPVLSDNYTSVLSQIREQMSALAIMDFSGDSNVPTGAIDYDSTNQRLRRYNGSGWDVVVEQTPAGVVTMFAGSSAPGGYILGDGAAVSRTTYSSLFAAIGTTYGSGDGSTTFNLPDCRQRFLLGKAASGTGSTLGSTGGAIDHTHTGPSHTHTVASHTHSVAQHTHTVKAHYHNSRATGATINITASGSHSHNIRYADTAGGGTARRHVRNDADAGDGQVGSSADTHTHANSSFSGLVGLVTGGLNGDSDQATNNGTGEGPTATGSTSLTTDTGGTAATGSNNPPYLALNCIIKY